MDTQLTGRVALVTGGSRGIGLAIARALSAEGADVVLLARDEERLRDAVTSFNGQAPLSISADLTANADVERAVEEAVAWKGRLDIVVNNAGPEMRPGDPTSHDDQAWLQALNTKALGMIRVCRAVASRLPDDGTGRIINVTGATARTIIPNGVITAVNNAAVQAFTGYLATELAARRITVNAVCPGMTDTDGWRDRLTAMGKPQGKTAEELQHGMTQGLGIRAGRWARPEEIGQLVAFLASDRGAYITGQTLPIDGGLIKAVA